MYTMRDTLFQLRHYIPAAFLSADSIDRMGEVARDFPANTSSYFGFESVLHDPAAVGDYLFCVWENRGNRNAISGSQPGPAIPEHFQTIPGWQNIRRFFREWECAGTLFHDYVDRVWLEYDMDDNLPAVPLPGFLFGMNKERPASLAPDQRYLDPQKYMQISRAALALLAPFQVSAPFESSLQHCFNSLPVSKVFQIGVMLARPVEAVRLCIKNLNSFQLLRFLRAVDWQGNWQALERILTEIEQRANMFTVSLDVGNTVFPRIGLECYLPPYPAGKAAWSSFMSYLQEEGCCTAEKARAMLEWPGISIEKLPHELIETVLFRVLHHVKLVVNPDGSLVAKGYTGFIHKWDPKIMQKFQRKSRSGLVIV